MIRHLAGVAEIVEDVDAAVGFYERLGLALKERHGTDYAVMVLPGALHFGIWSRAAAAESTFGSRDKASEVPLGFHIELEVDAIEQVEQQLKEAGWRVVQKPVSEPWGQRTLRVLAPAGGLLGFSETPWARQLTSQLDADGDAA